ncbi:MAG: DUF4492 domain-containing protein [Sulfurimonas sp.]|jgi:hypothetical protein|nr:DUF4492 domain-containing protein [Sulfurimonas sp.]
MISIKNIFVFYIDGFKNMKVGKSLWKIITIKLLIILVVLNYFVYDKTIKTEFKTADEKSNFVYQNLKGK